MKVKAFTLAESIMVLVLSAIVLFLVLNANQLVNSIYKIYVTNGKKIESTVELQKILYHEAFRCTQMAINNGAIVFSHENDIQTILSMNDLTATVSYYRDGGQNKTMAMDSKFRILDSSSEDRYLTSLLLEINFEEALHTIEIKKNYTSAQKLAQTQ